MTTASVQPSVATPARSGGVFASLLLLLVCAPWGFVRLRRRRAHPLILVSYAVLGLPVFLTTYTFFGILAFASFLPDLDLSVAEHLERTVRFKEGNYESTFLETAADTNGAHEFIRVVIQPHGGNHPHYHRTFEETFTTVAGELTVHVGSEVFVLKPGESKTAPAGAIHWFENPRDDVTVMTVRVTPARGLEKSIRVAYGLSNDSRWDGASRIRNAWRMIFMLAYSETFIPGLPGVIQEPLIRALAKIGQWLGEDEELMVYFR